MYPLLILREEIICLIILIFLWINGRYYNKMGKDRRNFHRIALYGTGHVIFDIITVLTVNNLDTVPAWLNYTCHVIFYLFAISFSQEFFCYITATCYSRKVEKKLRRWSLVPPALYLTILPFLPIVYLEGNGTNYSYGMAAFVGYAVAMLFFLASAVVLALRYRFVEPHVRTALVPMLAAIMASEIIQIAVPELLFTGAAATVVTVGFFFSLENPAEVFKQKLLLDALTGVQNRHSYDMDMEQLELEYAIDRDLKVGVVFCDINNLKMVNDKFGHLEGDAYIGRVAMALTHCLKSAENIYRMGGDEFLAIYRNTSEEQIKAETDRVHAECEESSRGLPYCMGLAIGYAMTGDKYPTLLDVVKEADFVMYRMKVEMKKELAIISPDGQKLNISGLTDRVFDAFAATGDRNYLTLCNMSTNVSRWSVSAVDYFGLPGEFMFDCLSTWLTYIHPDDLADYRADITAVFEGQKKYHDIRYRVRNKLGEYVVCTCWGTVLKGKNGEPDLFVATLVNHGLAETVDPVTGLPNEEVFVPYVQKLFREHTRAAFLKIRVTSFSRINLLYGYQKGNELLCSLASILKRTLHARGEIFRQDGTRFILCIPGGTEEDLSLIYSALQNALRREISLDDMVIPLSLAGGCFIMDESFTGNSLTIRNNLTYALEQSEFECHGNLVFYGRESHERTAEEHRLLGAIHQDAVADRAGFYLEYQPVLDMASGRVIGAEALLRWSREDFGKVTPGRFIPWLENDPCFFHVGKCILQRALADGRKILARDPGFTVNVNVTALQLEDERFNATLLQALAESGFPASQLCLELTERCRELDIEFLKKQIIFFRRCGIRVALDDVGTGFSSLDILLRLPVDEIKIDRSFIVDIRSDPGKQVFVQAIVDAAKTMNCRCCVEGIEDRKTYDYLKRCGADSYQGYYFSKPVPLAELEKLMENQK